MRLVVRYKDLSNCNVNLPRQLANTLSLNYYKPKSLGLVLSWVATVSGSSSSSSTKKKTEPRQALVGWSGGCTGRKDELEVSAQLAEALGLREGQAVGVEAAESVPTATTVMVEPASEDDWEVIELHSQFLEERLLSQVQFVFEGETLPLWVLGDTLAYVRVTKVVGADITPKTRGFARIAQDGQVVIAPKPRTVMPTGSGAAGEAPTRVWLRAYCVKEPPGGFTAPEAVSPPGYVAYTGVQCAELAGKFFVAKTRSREFCEDGSRKIVVREHRAVLRMEALPSVKDGRVALLPEAAYALGCRGTHQVVLFEEVLFQPPTCRVDKVVIQELRRGNTAQRVSIGGDSVSTAVAAFKEWFAGNIGKFADPVPMFPSFVMASARDGRLFKACINCDVSSPCSEVPVSLYSSSIHAATQFAVSDVQCTVTPIHDLFHPDLSLYEEEESRIGGYSQEFQDAFAHCELCAAPLLRNVGTQSMGLSAPGGLLVTGTRGVGKTSFALTLAQKFCAGPDSAYVVHVPCTRLATTPPVSKSESPAEVLSRLFWECVRNAPAVIVLDDIDALVPGSGSGGEEDEEARPVTEVKMAQQVRELLDCLSEVYANLPVAVVATAQSMASMNPLLQSPSVFEKVVELMPPTKAARKEIFLCALRTVAAINVLDETALGLPSVVLSTEGFVAADIVQVVERAVSCATNRGAPPSAVSREDLSTALNGFTPLSLMGTKAVVSSDVVWDDIGGLEDVKRTLKETLEWPAKYPALFDSCPIRLRSGVLLYGPPGCGKTMLAQAVATECAMNFISVKGPELLSKYIGQSELAVRDLFRRARAAKPSVLFFDEFDALAPRRGHDTTGVTDRVVNQLLTQLDGVEALTGVYVLAASSRPDLIDPALLRPGRIDLSLYCGFPGKDDLRQILGAMTRKMPLATNVSLDRISEWCAGRDYTPADLRAALYSAQLAAVKKVISESVALEAGNNGSDSADIFEVLQGQEDSSSLVDMLKDVYANEDSEYEDSDDENEAEGNKNKLEVTEEEIMLALETTRPSISPAERRRYNSIYAEFLRAKTGVNLDNNDDDDKRKKQIQTLA